MNGGPGPTLEFRLDEESSQGTMTPEDFRLYREELTDDVELRDFSQTPQAGALESLVEEDERPEDEQHEHQHQRVYIDVSAIENEMDEDDRPPSTRVPTQTMRAKLVRTPANKDDRTKSPEFEEYDDPDVHEPDVLITELKDPPRLAESGYFVSDSESDIEDEYKQVTVETNDGGRESPEWDTDLEIEDEVMKAVRNHDPSGRAQYDKLCERMGLVPISYFKRHILDHDITMRWRGLGPSASKAIALILRDNITLEKLNLQGNWIEGPGAVSIARMLEDNDYITEMVLSDNRLGTIGASCMCKMMQTNAGLRKLDLSGNNFDDKDALIFAEALENTKFLKELHLARNQFGSEAGEILGPAISANDILEVLDLSWNHIRGKGAISVAKGIGENVRLKACNVSWNGFGPEGGAAIGEALSSNNSLLEVDISGNRLNAETALKMARMITTNDTMRTLKMGNNLLTTAGVIALATSINSSENSEIEELDITDVHVEFEFLRILEDIKAKKVNFKVIHGPVLCSGNTAEDLGKTAIHPHKRKEPVMILDEHIVVNDARLLNVLKKYDPDGGFSVTPEDFVLAVEDLAVPFNKPKLQEAVQRLADTQDGRIDFGAFVEQRQQQQQIQAQTDEQQNDEGVTEKYSEAVD